MPSSFESTLQQAIALHKRGDGAAAEALYRAVLAQEPAHGEANHNLGMLLAQRGLDAQSLPLFQTALKSQPKVGQYWISYAGALLATGHPREAQIVLARGQQSGLAGPAVDGLLVKAQAASVPSQTDLKFELGTAHAIHGRMEDAIAAFRDVIAIAPDHAEAHFRLGSILSETGHVAEGFAHYMRRAALVHSDRAPARQGAAPAHRAKHDREQVEYLAASRGIDLRTVPFHLEDGARLPGHAVNPDSQAQARGWQETGPQMVVIDKFLTPAALEKLRTYCAGSTIWHRNYDAG